LGLPQFSLPNSDVPFDAAEAVTRLEPLLRENLPEFNSPLLTETDFFQVWSQLVRRYGPVLIEKSPHHLYQPAVLELLERYADAANDISVSFIGLVRNPIATMYSSWRRFGISPYTEERHWIRAYRSLAALAQRRADLLAIVRYEDLVSSDHVLAGALGLVHARHGDSSQTKFHGNSVDRWKGDDKFGYQPSPETIEVARAYGYTDDELQNRNAKPWSVHRVMRTVPHSLFWRLPWRVQGSIKSVGKKLRASAKRLGPRPGGRSRSSEGAPVAGEPRCPRTEQTLGDGA
jgi:hypothetical protein